MVIALVAFVLLRAAVVPKSFGQYGHYRGDAIAELAARPVAHAGLRLKEAAKLGFEIGWVPKGVKGGEGLRLADFGNLRQLVDQVLGR